MTENRFVRKVYRSKEWARGLALTGAGITLALFTHFLSAEGLHPARRALGFGLALLVGYFLLGRVAGSGIRLTTEGITVVNPFVTRRVPWSDILSFRVEQWAVFPGIGSAVLADGSVIRVFGIQAPDIRFRPNDRHADELVEELNGILRQRAR